MYVKNNFQRFIFRIDRTVQTSGELLRLIGAAGKSCETSSGSADTICRSSVAEGLASKEVKGSRIVSTLTPINFFDISNEDRRIGSTAKDPNLPEPLKNSVDRNTTHIQMLNFCQ